MEMVSLGTAAGPLSRAGSADGGYRLKRLVREASDSLARLDATRLEELAACCEALNRAPGPEDPAGRGLLEVEMRGALGEMLVLARVLEATRSNLKVMRRLRDLRQERMGYAGARPGWAAGGGEYGEH